MFTDITVIVLHGSMGVQNGSYQRTEVRSTQNGIGVS